MIVVFSSDTFHAKTINNECGVHASYDVTPKGGVII